MDPRDSPTAPDEIHEVPDDSRQRFIATFPGECGSILHLVDQVESLGSDRPVAALAEAVQRLGRLTESAGFPTVSARVADLGALVAGVASGTGAFDALRARVIIDAMHEAFSEELESSQAHARQATSAVAETPAIAVLAPALTAPASGAKILVAEYEPTHRSIVAAYLANSGYSPIAVESGDLVVDVARAERPALILLDIAMPGLDGYSACRLLKADAELAAIPVVLTTTGATVEDRLTGLSLGAEDILSKPLDMRELVLRIELMLKRCDRRPDPASGTAPTTAPDTATILIAEDDPDVTGIVDSQLRAAGYTAVIAFDGEQALEAVRDHSPALVVLDLMMPTLDGFEVLAKLGENPGPRPRVIVLTGRVREGDMVRAFELGADDYMTKPFNPQELMARIARLLRRDTASESAGS